MDAGTLSIIVSVVAVGATVGIGLAVLIVTMTGRLGVRLTAVEKETARMSGLLRRAWSDWPTPSGADCGRLTP